MYNGQNKIRLICWLVLPMILFCISPVFVKGQSLNEIAKLKRQLTDSKGISRIELLFDISRYYIMKIGENKTDLDSANVLNNQAEALSLKLKYKVGLGKSLVLRGMLAAEKKEKAKAFKLLNSALSYFRANQLGVQEARTLVTLAYLYGNEGNNLRIKTGYLNKSLDLYRRAGKRQNVAEIFQELGDISQLNGDYEKALSFLEQSLTEYKAVDKKDIQGLYSLYGEVYRSKGHYFRALKYALLAATTAEKAADTSQLLCAIYNRIGTIYKDLNKDNLAISWYEKSRAVALKLKDPTSTASLNMNIADVLLKNGKLKEAIELLKTTEKLYKPEYLNGKIRLLCLFVEAFVQRKELRQATPYYEQLKAGYRTMPKGNPLVEQICSAMINYLQVTGQYKEAYSYIRDLELLTQSSHNMLHRAQVELMYYKTDSASARYQDALSHYRLYKGYSDSLFNTEIGKQLAGLQLQFEAEEKDKNIRLLTQKNQFQQDIINRDKIIRKTIIGGSILLLMLLVLSFNRYRLKKQSHSKLQAKQEEINAQNERLKKLVKDKEWLLKEVHHRVKNNLQIVISLLNTQSSYLDNEEALLAIRNSQHRMYAMSLIHQRLYQANNMSCIDMGWYIKELINYLKDSFYSDKKIGFVLDIDSFDLDVVQAVPLGLIVNEAVTNAIKYAFPKEKDGTIEISLKLNQDHLCSLMIKDNGIGLPESFDADENGSFGMSLIKGLTGQLGGDLKISELNGITILVSFLINQNTNYFNHTMVQEQI